MHCKQQKSISPFLNKFWRQSLAEMWTQLQQVSSIYLFFFIYSCLLHKHSCGVWLVTNYKKWDSQSLMPLSCVSCQTLTYDSFINIQAIYSRTVYCICCLWLLCLYFCCWHFYLSEAYKFIYTNDSLYENMTDRSEKCWLLSHTGDIALWMVNLSTSLTEISDY